MKQYVVDFCLKHNIRLDRKTSENYRIIPFTVYHAQLPLGTCRKGITDGLHAHLLSPLDNKTYEVHWSNCRKADTGENAQFKTGKSLQHVRDKKPPKPKKVSAHQQKLNKLEELLKDF